MFWALYFLNLVYFFKYDAPLVKILGPLPPRLEHETTQIVMFESIIHKKVPNAIGIRIDTSQLLRVQA